MVKLSDTAALFFRYRSKLSFSLRSSSSYGLDPKPHRVGCIDLEIKVEHQTFGTFHHKLWRELSIASVSQGAHRTDC
jgi:hypothetical protein